MSWLRRLCAAMGLVPQQRLEATCCGRRQLHGPPLSGSPVSPQLLPAVAADPSSVGSSRVLLLKAKYVELVQRGLTGEALQVRGQQGRAACLCRRSSACLPCRLGSARGRFDWPACAAKLSRCMCGRVGVQGPGSAIKLLR